MRMADQVLLLLPAGPVVGSPAELRRSADPTVAEFLSDECAVDPADVAGDPVRQSI
jgi:hypothetical protein